MVTEFFHTPGVIREVKREGPDIEAFHQGVRTGPCFVCEIVA